MKSKTGEMFGIIKAYRLLKKGDSVFKDDIRYSLMNNQIVSFRYGDFKERKIVNEKKLTLIKFVIRNLFNTNFYTKSLVNETATEPSKEICQPIVLQIENTSDKEQEFVLFGFNEFLLAQNHGNNKHVKIINLHWADEKNGYSKVLLNSGINPIKTILIRLQSECFKNIRQDITVVKKKCNGSQYTKPHSFYLDPEQQQSDIVDKPLKCTIDNITHMKGTIQPNSIIVISFFYTEIKK